MKKRLIIILILSFIPTTLLAQNTTGKDTLDVLKDYLQSGFFIRKIPMSYIKSLNKHERIKSVEEKKPNKSKDTTTYQYYKFTDFKIDTTFTDNKVYVGIVFISERYLEAYFNENLLNRDSTTIKNDKNGFYFICKLYSLKGKPYLNIYPDFTAYICNKNIHNTTNILSFRKTCKTLEQHQKAVRLLAAIPDFDFNEHYNNEVDIKDSINNDTLIKRIKKDTLNIKYKTAKRLLLEFNINKQIKAFSVDNGDLNHMYTKYKLSDDKFINMAYHLIYESYKSMNSDTITVLNESFDPNNNIDTKADSTLFLGRNNAKFISENNQEETIYEKKQSNNYWIYGGKINLQNKKIVGEELVKFSMSNINFEKINITQNTTQTIETLTDIYARESKPEVQSGIWKKGKILGITKKGKTLNSDKYILIPGIDGKPLLWFNIEE